MDIVVRVGVLARESDRSEIVRDRLSRISCPRSQIPRRFRGLLRPLSVLRSPTSRLRELPERPTLIGNGDHVVGIVGQLPKSKLVGLPVGLPSFAPPTRRPHASDVLIRGFLRWFSGRESKGFVHCPLTPGLADGQPVLLTASGHVKRACSSDSRCSDKDRPVGLFLPADWPGPGGLKGRDTLDEPGRRKHHREQRDRGAWFERRDASFVITRELCSLERQRVPGVESAEGFLDSSILI